MKMAYIASDPKTRKCFAICSADPDFAEDALKEVKDWKRRGSIIELLPKDEAKARFLAD